MKPKNQSSVKRAGLYLRFSSQEQGQNTYTTIDAQRQFLTAWAAQNGYTVVCEFADEAKTGTTLNRAGYRALRQAAGDRAFEVVIVTYMDRLGRGKAFTIAEHELSQAGVQVITALQTFTSDTGGYISQTARQMVDGIYPRLVSEWTVSKMVQMLAQGYHCAGRAPFGYNAVPVEVAYLDEGKKPPKRLVPDAQAADVVREAFRRAADGETKAAIGRYLSDMTGEEWRTDKTSRLLSSRVYRGVATWGQGPNRTNETAHLPLVDETLWQEAQAALNEKSPLHRERITGQAEYYLAGRVKCSCGRNMTSYWARGRGGIVYRYYQCMGTRSAECKAQVSASALHDAVFMEASALARVPWRLRQTLEEARRLLPDLNEAKRDAVRLRREGERLKRERDRFVAALRVSPTSAIQTLSIQLGEVETAIKTNAVVLADVEAVSRAANVVPTTEECQAILSRLGRAWAVSTDAEKKEIAPDLVQSVTYHAGRSPRVTARYYVLDSGSDEMREGRLPVRLRVTKQGRFPIPALNPSRSNLSASPTVALTFPILRRARSG